MLHARCSACRSSLYCPAIPRDGSCYSHFIDEETKASEGAPSHPAGDFQWLDLNHGLSESRVFAFIMHSGRPRRKGAEGAGVGQWEVGMLSTSRSIPY